MDIKRFFKKNRLVILISLNVIMVLILGGIFFTMYYEQNQAAKLKVFAPDALSASSTNVPDLTLTAAISQALTLTPIDSIRTPFPTPTRRATITPFPTMPPVATLVAPRASGSTTPQKVDCNAYAYTKATYLANVNFSKGYYRPIISMYQKRVSLDTTNGDTIAAEQDQAYLTANQAALDNAIADETKQYNAIVPEVCR